MHVIVDPPAARVTVTDDGRGLQRPRPDSVGIRGMKERAARIGARLSIGPVPPPATGTTVEVVLEGSTWGRRSGEPVARDEPVRESVSP